ncbi:MAG: hypothetical protein J4F98_03245 [Acidobacteria bacterium]|nr:hypothetical protein [Acidobacteriota bacterium]
MIGTTHRGLLAGLVLVFLYGPAFASPGPREGEPTRVAGSSSVPVLVEDHFVDTVADSSGPVPVSVVDGEGFEQGQHGQRVTDNFLANTRRSRLVQISGWGIYELDGRRLRGANSRGFIRHVLARGDGGIFFTSTGESPIYSERLEGNWFLERGRPFYKNTRAFARWMQDQDTLLISSLQNPTGRGLGQGGIYCDDFALNEKDEWIPLCGAGNDYIAHSGVGLEKTVFVGAIDSYGVARAAIRGDGVFARAAIYVESTDGSTSQATPVLAAYATNLAFSNPDWDAARLKRELMGLAVEEVVDHATGGSNEFGNTLTERRVVKVIRPAFAPKGDPPSDPPPLEPPGPCVADAETLCLREARYAVAVEWRTADGEVGVGSAVQDGTDDSGLFTFFDPDNWEILIKVLDGCAVNGHVWVYGASTTDLGYTITVTDTETGDTKRYSNEAGRPAVAITDVGAFPGGCANR